MPTQRVRIVDPDPVVGSVTVAGGATEAKQDTGNASLATLVTQTDTIETLLGLLNAQTDGVEASLTSIDSKTTADVAHDDVDSGSPKKIGAVAIAHGTNPTAVAAADRTNLYANRHGVMFMVGGHPNAITVEAEYTGAQTDTAIVTIAGGLKIVVTQIQFTCDNANTVDVGFRVGFGAAATPTTTGVVASHPGVAPGSGISRGNGSGIIGVGTDGQDLRITCEAPTTGAARVLVTYYTIES